MMRQVGEVWRVTKGKWAVQTPVGVSFCKTKFVAECWANEMPREG